MAFFAAMPGALMTQLNEAITNSSAAMAMASAANSEAATARSESTAALAAGPGMTAWNELVSRCLTLEQAVLLRSFGFAPIPALALGASTNVDVEIGPARPNTNYTPVARSVALVSVLATLTINSVTVLTASTVRVSVTCSGVLAGGAAFVVVRV